MLPILLLLTPAYPPATPAGSQHTELVSVDSRGIQGSGDSEVPALSADGRFVAFHSWATNLAPGDTNGVHDVFVHDRRTGRTTRVSVDTIGTQGNGQSREPSISGDGRFVAFHSAASNLVAGDTNGRFDVFVHDRWTNQTTRVSLDSGAVQGNGDSMVPSISADGRLVAFSSWASNLVPGDTNGRADAFVHDRQTGQTTRVSEDSGGLQGNGDSFAPAISADGRFVAFHSRAANLVIADTNGVPDVFIHDRLGGLTTRVSVDSGGLQGNWDSYDASISRDGRFVAFESGASNLVPGDSCCQDVFVHDRQTGQTTRVSVDSGGLQANGSSAQPSISGDGRFVAFESSASNLVPGDTNGWSDVFVHDRQTAQTSRVSLDSRGLQGNSISGEPSASADGRYVAFESSAWNLVPGDTNGYVDVFVHDGRPIAPLLSVSGSCPGPMTFDLDAVSPEGGVAFVHGTAGSSTLTTSACAGTTLDLAQPQLGAVVRASWLGTVTRTWPIAPATCGRSVQALDLRTCETSNVVVL